MSLPEFPLSQWPPSKLSEFVGKYVSVNTETLEYEGFVDAIDPVTGSVMLCTCNDDDLKLVIVNGNSVINIFTKEAPIGCKYISMCQEKSMDIDNLQSAKSQVYTWLSKNMLPVKDVNDVLFVYDDSVIINPPYKAENCICSNSIILGRIQHLLKNMPDTS